MEVLLGFVLLVFLNSTRAGRNNPPRQSTAVLAGCVLVTLALLSHRVA